MRVLRAPAALLLIAALGLYAADTFSAADTGPRVASASVVADASAYLALSANPEHPFAPFVSEDPESGLVSVAFGAVDSLGEGLAAGVRHHVHDLLLVTNQGVQAVFVQAIAESSAGTLHACMANDVGGMTRGCYAPSSPAAALRLDVGESAYVGLALDASELAEGEAFAGALRIVACRAASSECALG